MQTISFTAFKGGSGKTTALMAIASVLVARGKRVALMEADDNEPLKVWKKYGADLGTWDDLCKVYPATDLNSLNDAYERAESEGTDFALVDTRGGGSDLNQAVMMNSNLIVIPTSLSIMEIDEALSSLEYAGNFMKSTDLDVPIGLLINRISTGKLTTAEADSLRLLGELPVFENHLPDRRIFNEMKGVGLLHHYHRKLAQTPAKRILSTHTRVALNEAERITDEMLEAISVVELA